MAWTRSPLRSQTSWPAPISVATAPKAIGRFSIWRPSSSRVSSSRSLPPDNMPDARKGQVHQAEHAALGQRAREPFERGQAPGGVAAADDRADRRAGDDVDRHAARLELLQDADMGPAASGAGAERKTDARALPAGGTCASAAGEGFSGFFERLPIKTEHGPVLNRNIRLKPRSHARYAPWGHARLRILARW